MVLLLEEEKNSRMEDKREWFGAEETHSSEPKSRAKVIMLIILCIILFRISHKKLALCFKTYTLCSTNNLKQKSKIDYLFKILWFILAQKLNTGLL